MPKKESISPDGSVGQRPTVDPSVIASITHQAPERVRRKIDRDPQAAEGWTWQQNREEWLVDSGGEQVRLRAPNGRIESPDMVQCSCLLSPRCFHVLSCLIVLDVATTASGDDEGEEGRIDPGSDAERTSSLEGSVTLEETQAAAARHMWNEASAVLAAGGRAAGSLAQAQVLRAVHECRSVGLHRLSAAGLRVIQGIRRLRADDSAFRSDALIADYGELLEVAWRLMRPGQRIDRTWVGTARRQYQSVSSLRLQGLFTEPVLTRSGYAGVVTYLIGHQGQLMTVSHVRPGDAGRVKEALRGGVDLGGLSISHRQLGSSGLLLQNPTVSADGRVGGGKDCRAATTAGKGWDAQSVSARFSLAVEQQVERVFASMAIELDHRGAGWDLLFLRGRLLGSDGQRLLLRLAEGQGVIRLCVAQWDESLAFRENLQLLARAPQLAIRCIARLAPAATGEAAALAVAPDPAEAQDDEVDTPKLKLPLKWSGHVNLGLDRLQRGHLTAAERAPVVLSVPTEHERDDGLEPLRRRVRGMVLGGRHSLPTGSVNALARDARQLHGQSQPVAACLLGTLAQSAIETETSLLGVRFPADAGSLAERWLACAHYEVAARRAFHKRTWSRAVKAETY